LQLTILLIYRLRRDERLSWPGWLTYSGWFTYLSVHLSPTADRSSAGQESLPAKDRRTFYRSAMQPTKRSISSVYFVTITPSRIRDK